MIVVDTGVLYAAFDDRDADHVRCGDFVAARLGELTLPAPVIVEAAQLIHRRVGPEAEASFAWWVAEVPAIQPLGAADYVRAAQLLETYEDLRLGFVDASVVAVAERLRVTTLASLNRRDFLVVRPSHAEAFELVP